MRILATIIILLGLASIVLGVIMFTQSGTARDEVAESIAPLELDQLDDSYDMLAASIDQIRASGADPDVSLTARKTGLGLARANVGKATMLTYNGIVDIILGAGLVLAGLGVLRKSEA